MYDFKSLFRDGKLMDLNAWFHNLPLVLSQKERIRPEFREYTANTLYDVAVHKRFFNEQDRVYANEPRHVREAAQSALIRAEGPRFFKFLDATLDTLAQVVAGYDKEEHERHGFYFRRQAWEFILGSEFLKRTNLKPRGYAGDSEMMHMLYENQHVGNYVFNKLLHKHPVQSAAAQAVRNRRLLIPKVLRQALAQFPNLGPQGFRFISVACGPAAEMQDLFLVAEDFEKFHCTLLDQDTQALDEARCGLARIEQARNIRVGARFINESVRTMLKTADLSAQWGHFHFLYCMGLFDYLLPPVARAVLKKLYHLLEPGGTMVVGNYHVNNPTRIYMEYWMDWVLYYRTEEDFLEMSQDLAGAEKSVVFEETGSQMFLVVRKPG